jgi:hypothetical protein
MTNPTRTFAVASDDVLVSLISQASTRLVVIAPALTHSVAKALARRLDELGTLSVTVILDSDAEVYRLGFGDEEALELIRSASGKALFDLREQAGVRIGVIVSDDTMMVFSPVCRNIEAGSTSVTKPNAVILTGAVADRIATATGADAGRVTQRPKAGGDAFDLVEAENGPGVAKPEVGEKALDPTKVEKMQANLKANPPKPFDITRKLNVFTSKVQYVEFSASNYRLTTRQIPLPPELVDVADDELKSRITSRIRAPFDGIGKIEIEINENGNSTKLKIDDEWLKRERKRIEDEYTYQINNFGRIILYNDRARFDQAVARFETIVKKYQSALGETLKQRQEDFQKKIVDEFSGRWKQTPPDHFSRWNIEPTDENIAKHLEDLSMDIFKSAVTFDPPIIKILYKNVAPENIRDAKFLDTLKQIMLKKRVPREIVDSLFESGQAAPQSGAFVD